MKIQGNWEKQSADLPPRKSYILVLPSELPQKCCWDGACCCSLTDVRVPYLPSQRNYRSRLQPWKQCHYYSCAPNQACDSLGLSQEEFWSDTTPPSSHEGRATTWDAQSAEFQQVTARTVLPAPPAGGLFPTLFARNLPSFPCTAGNCSGLDGISTWLQGYHMFRFP